MFVRLFVLLLLSFSLHAQDRIDSEDGKLIIKDSIALQGQGANDIFNMLKDWAAAVSEKDSAGNIIMKTGRKLAGEIALNLPVGRNTSDIGNYVYQTQGIMTYTKGRVKGGSFGTSPSFGGIRYAFNIFITEDQLFYEFRDIEYSKNMVHYTPIEAKEPPAEDGRKNVTALAMKNWATTRTDYTEFLQALTTHLKTNSKAALDEILAATTTVNYDNYKKISIGMGYADVSALLADEGRELSNSQSKQNGKSVLVQSIIWRAPRGEKTITINFENGKVTGKSQTNL